MDITIHSTFLPRNDVGYDGMRWITVGPADRPGTSIVLEPTEQPYGLATALSAIPRAT